jgi:hypothetical protein
MLKKNCWEATNCGRKAGGRKAAESGICPASLETAVDGLNDGKNGGRVCWAIPGTLCDGEIQYFETQKWGKCRRCTFFWKVHREERANYAGVACIMERLILRFRLAKRAGTGISAGMILS